MPPKAAGGPSKKTVDKAKAKIIEDKTFGLKNKNRSAKVQKFVQQVTSAVKQGSQADRQKAKEMETKKSAKEAKAAYEAEMAALFKVVKQEKTGSESGDDDSQEGCDPDEYLWRPEDFDEVEADDGRLEDRLEAEREALKGRTDLTPVTEESFRLWKERKLREKQEAEAARLRRAKETGQLRGWDLWEHDRSLFVDDEDADDFYEREEVGLNEEEADDTASGAPVATHRDPTAA
jgi:hypothetical protein